MRLSGFLQKVHNYVTALMSQCPLVEKYLIAQVETEDGDVYDCIYCTILRNAVLFGCIGVVIGFLLGRFLWQ